MTFTLPIVPPKTTSQMKRLVIVRGKPVFFKNRAGVAAENDYLSLLEKHKPAAPLCDAVELAITFTWPHLSGTSAKRLGERIPKTTRPDADNLVKQLADCLVKLQFIRDDGQIARLILEKFHGPEPGVTIRLDPFEVTR